MKKTILIAIAGVLLGVSSHVYAKYVTGFKVTELSGKEVTIQKGDDEPIMLKVKKVKKYKVGDAVKYDAAKGKIIPDVPEGC